MYRKNNKKHEDRESSFDSVKTDKDKNKYSEVSKDDLSNNLDVVETVDSDVSDDKLEDTDNQERKDNGMDRTLSILIHSFNEPIESSIEAYHVRELDSFLMNVLQKNSLDYTLILADYEAQDLMNAYDVFLNAIFRSIIRIDSDVLLKEGLITTHGYKDDFDSETLYLSNSEEEENE